MGKNIMLRSFTLCDSGQSYRKTALGSNNDFFFQYAYSLDSNFSGQLFEASFLPTPIVPL